MLSNPITADSEPESFALDVRALGVRGVRRENSPGLGLGLDIAQRLCNRAGLAMEWRIHEGAFIVTLRRAT